MSSWNDLLFPLLVTNLKSTRRNIPEVQIDAAQHTRSANRRGATYQKRKSTRRNTPEAQIDAAQHSKSAKTNLGNFWVVQNEATWTLGFTHSASCMLTVYGNTHTDVAEIVTIIFT
jgi:hypothetical protein